MRDSGSILQTIINIFSQPFIFVYSILPHEIKDFGVAILNFVLDNLFSIKPTILNCIENLGETSPDLVAALSFLKLALVIYLNIFYLFYILRLVLYWFPNYNPYLPPLYIVVVVTQPTLTFFEEILPKIFGIDFSFIVVTLLITTSIKVLDNLNF